MKKSLNFYSSVTVKDFKYEPTKTKPKFWNI